ncbi:hypothetical protein [Lysobacter sp. ESA13C]|uniref:hypothetical protein n=1 Tax=Lysobacter sp. ESA13C TaxID=2862676 RepID=UPI001CBE3A1F|nr:hypothetical protein [Lysobacter sp. ESA13C]
MRRFIGPHRLERDAICLPYARNETSLLVPEASFLKAGKHLGNSGLRTLCCDSGFLSLDAETLLGAFAVVDDPLSHMRASIGCDEARHRCIDRTSSLK